MADQVIIKEGKAEILFENSESVFYNPVQEFNRDMSIAAITQWKDQINSEKLEKYNKKMEAREKTTPHKDSLPPTIPSKNIRILEGLAATGLRSIRYAKEIDNVSIVTNDFDPVAVETIEKNLLHNKVNADGNVVIETSLGDASYVMYKAKNDRKLFDVIDLDPYGSASQFIDAAVQSVSNGGLLCVTCTDLIVLAGGQTEANFTKYGGTNLSNTPYCHEMALRSVLNTIQVCAARYRKSIVPLVSCSIDFYIRIFVRVFDKPVEAKKAACNSSMVYHCYACKSFQLQPIGRITVKAKNNQIKYGTAPAEIISNKCWNCDTDLHIAGPTYNGPLHDKEFVKGMIKHVKDNKGKYGTEDRMVGMLSVIDEELDTPFYYNISTLSSTLHCETPSILAVSSALLNANFQISLTHCQANCIKTTAPPKFVYDIMREWIKTHPVREAKGDAKTILDKEITSEQSINFQKHKDAEPASRKIKLVRFQENPTANWGPKKRASGKRKREE